MAARRGVRAYPCLLLVLLLAACDGEPAPYRPGVFVIGFDGMEPTIVEREMDLADREPGKGMPNFARLRREGGYSRLGTSLPPESPVAWASFITGRDPGGHGRFDFIHRKPVPGGIRLFLSTAETTEPSRFISLFGYRWPLSGGETRLLVKGTYFWEHLTERDIPVTVVRIPSNYPPKDVGARTFSGMGTPDLLGDYGVFSYYTDFPPLDSRKMRDARVFPVEIVEHHLESVLYGPRNTFVSRGPNGRHPHSTVPIHIYRDPDPERQVARIEVGEEIRVLSEGEWSDWVPVEFPLVPGVVSASGMVRLYLQEVHPHLRLYVSPVNADPLDPEITLSTPEDAGTELARSIGRYYTQGMAEETQALRYGIFDTGEFLQQAEIVLEERRRMLDHEIERFREVGGFTFFYFSTTDLTAHMLFKYLDEEHPLYEPEEAAKYGGRLVEIYREMDRLLGEVMDRVPEGTRIVTMSDHGFKSLRRQMNLNTWLYEHGYLALKDPSRIDGAGFENVDWAGTQAYSVGFSGIYLNLVGREDPGSVLPGKQARELGEEIAAKLEEEVAVKVVYRREDVYHGDEVENAPDLIVGFDLHYGCSEESATGTVSRKLYHDTDDAWTGSHLMDPDVVPGILLVNAKIDLENPALTDLATSILAEFGIVPEGMTGRRIWRREDD